MNSTLGPLPTRWVGRSRGTDLVAAPASSALRPRRRFDDIWSIVLANPGRTGGHDQHGDPRPPKYPFARAANEQVKNLPVAVGTHDDEIGLQTLCLVKDFVDRTVPLHQQALRFTATLHEIASKILELPVLITEHVRHGIPMLLWDRGVPQFRRQRWRNMHEEYFRLAGVCKCLDSVQDRARDG